jgi:hypothetical protein
MPEQASAPAPTEPAVDMIDPSAQIWAAVGDVAGDGAGGPGRLCVAVPANATTAWLAALAANALTINQHQPPPSPTGGWRVHAQRGPPTTGPPTLIMIGVSRA